MLSLRKGRYKARFAVSEPMSRRRSACGTSPSSADGRGAASGTADGDAFDADLPPCAGRGARTGRLVCCFRLLPLRAAARSG
jgi:L-ornithine Nalpha-acyltransferase